MGSLMPTNLKLSIVYSRHNLAACEFSQKLTFNFFGSQNAQRHTEMTSMICIVLSFPLDTMAAATNVTMIFANTTPTINENKHIWMNEHHCWLPMHRHKHGDS